MVWHGCVNDLVYHGGLSSKKHKPADLMHDF